MSNVSYNLGNSKPLINREQNYVLDRRLLSVHSEDRDITKWPKSNHFEIIMPETMYNVQSLRVVQSTFPNNYYVFSNNYQNTMFYVNDSSLVTIQSGLYSTPEQLASELTIDMSNALADINYMVEYNDITQKFTISNSSTALDFSFNLNFDTQVLYDVSCNNDNNNPTMWYQYINWGLPYNLGFEKKLYSGNKSYTATYTANITGETCFYMEIDKYNSYDELYPYNKSSCQLYDNNAYNGKVNSAFAKLSTISSENSRNLFLQNIVQYDPPIERIARLRFKFRYHDGRLVEFHNSNFEFTIEFNCLKNEIDKKYNVRIPATYLL
jgi:hypothetical protein